MKKRIICSIFICFCLMLTSCGSLANQVTKDLVATVSPTSEQQQITDPLAGLDADLTEAFKLGIADISLASQLDQFISQPDAVKLIKNADDLVKGKDHTKYLVDMAVRNINFSKVASRYFFAELIYYSRIEEVYGNQSKSADEFMDFYDQKGYNNDIAPDASISLIRHDAIKAGFTENLAEPGTIGESVGWTDMADYQNCFEVSDSKFTHHDDYGDASVAYYSILIFDRTTGIKVMSLDQNQAFNPQKSMTTEEAIRTALRYYRSFPQKAVEVTYQDAGTYNKSIITDELLNKNSTLPENSNHYLPQWKGVLVTSMMRVTKGAFDRDTDKVLTENEIKLIHDAGFNFIGLAIDFSLLQEPFFNQGTVNESQLEYLDQILAWCIKYDIHLDLRCSSPTGATDSADSNGGQNLSKKLLTDGAMQDDFAQFWSMLARRYSAIQNKYLSFNLLIEPEAQSDYQYVQVFKPAIEAIRTESPNRTIILDIHSGGLTGKAEAALGVAISYHLYDPREFTVLYPEQNTEYANGYLTSIQWPYSDKKGKVWDAKAMMTAPLFGDTNANALTVIKLKAIADQAGVGFMVGEWGIFGTPAGELLTESYPRKTIYAFDKDLMTTMNDMGIGWCMGNGYFGEYGLVTTYPAMKGVNYVPLENSNLFLDPDMLSFYQSILN